jgi:quercetin dioxygenase-like cupin family protein
MTRPREGFPIRIVRSEAVEDVSFPSGRAFSPQPCNILCVETEFFQVSGIEPFPMAEGVVGRPIFGKGAMLNVAELEPGAVVSEHSHPHEQIGLVLSGMMEMTVDGHKQMLGPMDGVVIPGDARHSAVAGPEGAVMLDLFQPIREDYRDRWKGGLGG